MLNVFGELRGKDDCIYRWPEEFAARYRKGYWQDLPLTNLITRHAENDAVAIIDGERQISYRQFNQLVDNACRCSARTEARETALVQLGNVAEFYMTFFAAAHRRRASERFVQPPAQRT
ncbi:Enterobactin synthase component E [Klebsiella pneumoniae]|nr:Enterobactin synthase component E [Klebsiella pneumoniae]